jgi:chromosome segregation ATPase
MEDLDPDWLGDLRWSGTRAPEGSAPRGLSPPATPKSDANADARLQELERENESLRARLEMLTRLAGDFERRLAAAGAAYESAVFDAESRLRDVTLERERLFGEADAAQAEVARLSARDVSREADLRLERERRADAEKALLESRRRLEEATAEYERLKNAAAQQVGALAELRRLASSQKKSE